MSRPHSAKMIAATPTRAHGPSQEMIVSGCSHAGPIAMKVVVTTPEGTDQAVPGSTPGSSSEISAQRRAQQHAQEEGDRERGGQPHPGRRWRGLRAVPAAGLPHRPRCCLQAQRLGQPLLRRRGGHQCPARGFITRPTASSARLAVDFTVPRVMPVASAISASDSPP